MRTLKEGLKLWKKFGDMPIDDNDNIEENFYDLDETLLFPKGTNRFEIWHWFEDTFEDFECRYYVT